MAKAKRSKAKYGAVEQSHATVKCGTEALGKATAKRRAE